MRIPGGNLFTMASRLIAQQVVQYSRWASRTPNDVGQDVDTYAEAVPMSGSVQAVPRALYQALGLDFTKSYVTFTTPNDIQDLGRDRTGDKFTYFGRTYFVESETDWHDIDGWTQALCVDVGAA